MEVMAAGNILTGYILDRRGGESVCRDNPLL